MSSRKCTVICIEGNIGAGKTTVIRNLSANKNFSCFEEPVEEWTLLPKLYEHFDKDNLLKKFIFSTALQIQILISQFDQFNFFPKDSGLVFVERCPWSSKNIFIPLLIQDKNFLSYYNKLYDALAYEVDYFIYLKVPAEIAFERVQKRNRKCEKISITLDYLRLLENQLDENFSKLRQNDNRKVFIIDATKSNDEIMKEVFCILKCGISQNLTSAKN